MAKEGGINITAMPLEQLNMMREQLQVTKKIFISFDFGYERKLKDTHLWICDLAGRVQVFDQFVSTTNYRQ